MQIVDIRTAHIESPTALALGYFDSFHLGHQKLLDNVLGSRYTPAMFTFSGNLYAALGLPRLPLYSEAYRMRVAEQCGLEYVLTLPADRTHIEMSADDFLETLLHADPALIVCGEDFRYGRGAIGGISRLERFCLANHIRLHVQPTVFSPSGKKISSNSIAEMVAKGYVTSANAMLGRCYMVEGVVEHGRGVGADIGYPTANFPLDLNLQAPCEGVYVAYVRIDGKQYRALCNVGAHPTVGDMRKNVETYVLGYRGDLYGRTLQVYLRKYIRPVKKFATVNDLAKQIAKDVMVVRRTGDT